VPPLEAQLDAWRQDMERRDLAPSTIAIYQQSMNATIIPEFEARAGAPFTCTAVTPEDVRALRESLLKAGKAPRTVNRV
jgi:hypothetical protein